MLLKGPRALFNGEGDCGRASTRKKTLGGAMEGGD